MSSLLYLAENTLFLWQNNQATPLSCTATEQYKKNLQQIKQRKDWKSRGTGAQFMGLTVHHDSEDFEHIYITDAVMLNDTRYIYVARLQEGVAIYSKDLTNDEKTEGLVLRKDNFIAHDMGYDAVDNRLILSASQPFELERHLCLLDVDGNHIRYLTEGECQDANPTFNTSNNQQVYYDSCGFAYNSQGKIVFGPKEICLLDMQTGSLDTLVTHPEFDFFKPQQDRQGNLYYLKRPYKHKTDPLSFVKDLLLAPFKIIKAIVGWLDFFTQRYTGESLKTAGSNSNPAKAKQKSAEALFIENNLIQAQKTLERNKSAGEKHPGIIPRSWELIRVSPSGETQTLKKGVLSYGITDNGIVYSNGKHLIKLDAHNTETLLSENKLISKIRFA